MEELGHCFEIAYRLFVKITHYGNFRLVHGFVDGQGPEKGLRFVHAWVEDLDRDIVLDHTLPDNRNSLSKDLYYKIGNIVESDLTRYTYDELLKNSVKFGTYGPWDPKYDEIITLNK